MNVISFLRKLKGFLKSESDREVKYALFKKQLKEFKNRLENEIEIIEYPCLNDNTGITPIEPHYTYHPAWAARVLAATRPYKHIDISSTTNFSTIASAF